MVARCTLARLMSAMGQGIVRGKKVRTTIPDPAATCPLNQVNRQFKAPRPNTLWVSDFTYVATCVGFVYVAFVIDALARRIVGWRASRTAHTRSGPACGDEKILCGAPPPALVRRCPLPSAKGLQAGDPPPL